MARKAMVLVVDGDEAIRGYVVDVLAAHGHAVTPARTADEAAALAKKERFDLLIAEIFLPGLSGIELLKRLREEDPDLAGVLMAREPPIRTIVAGMRAGAFDCIEKPIDLERLRIAVANALEHARLERENEGLRRETRAAPGGGGSDIVCASDAMREVLALVDKVAPTDLTVLVEGESGVGKELVASRLHRGSPRAAAPFIAINCGAIQASLLESELFGHEKGAFTGATSERQGLFEVADRGTIFLDEIGEMPLDLQVKLLRVLETSELRRVGGSRAVHVDIRVVAATNRRLADEVRGGRFREDLYYRLNVIAVEVPPLRRRKEEIPALVEAFVERARRRGMRRKRFTPEALAALEAYAWPGNVRELENLVERALILTRDDEVAAEDLPQLMRTSAAGRVEEPADSTDFTLAELERRHIIRALRKNKSNKVRTARKLGINVKTLYNKIKAYEIDEGALRGR
jgi:DNA-binding NtrC family response regulator